MVQERAARIVLSTNRLLRFISLLSVSCVVK